jgi:DNA polymerase III delta subunit
MSSKWRPWEFLKHHPQIIDTDKKCLTFIYCTDPFIERMLRNKLDFKSWDGQPALTISGMELSIDWIKDNLMSLSLFGGDQAVCVVQGNSISAAAKSFLLESEIADGSRHIVFFINGDKKFFSNWEKKSHGDFLEVEDPKFWEIGKLLTYFADGMSMRLPMDVHNYLMEAVPHVSADFVNTLKTIRLNFGTGPYSLQNVKSIIPATRLDQFRLATLLGKRNLVDFYKELEKLNLEFDEQIFFYKFLQGHLLKLMDISYIDKKARPSKYDKEIQSHSALWKPDDLQKVIRNFSKLEIQAKKKSPFIKEKIREFLLAEL